MKKLRLGGSFAEPLGREEMKTIVAGSGGNSGCKGSCSLGESTGECFTSVFTGICDCTAVGIGSFSCSGV